MNESLYPFVNHTTYDLNALRALNDIAEATVRKEKSRRTKFFGLILGVFGLVAGAMLYPKQNLIGSLLLLYGVVLLIMVLRWKSFQLRTSQQQLQKGMRECNYEFDEEEMICSTGAGVTHYPYEQMFAVVSSADWYAIFFDESHGVMLDKKGFIEGDAMSFKSFIGQRTMLPIQEI